MKRDVVDKLWTYLEYGIDVENRRIFLMQDIEEQSITMVVQALYLLETMKPNEDITLCIGTMGGDMYEMYKLYDVMNTISCDIMTIAMGKCMSAGPLLVANGTPGKRYALPNTWFMVHQSQLAEFNGTLSKVKADIEHETAMDDKWYALMERQTNRDAKFWRRQCNKNHDVYFNAETAIEYGIVDQIWVEK